jgi:hypothetical protein
MVDARECRRERRGPRRGTGWPLLISFYGNMDDDAARLVWWSGGRGGGKPRAVAARDLLGSERKEKNIGGR